MIVIEMRAIVLEDHVLLKFEGKTHMITKEQFKNLKTNLEEWADHLI